MKCGNTFSILTAIYSSRKKVAGDKQPSETKVHIGDFSEFLLQVLKHYSDKSIVIKSTSPVFSTVTSV